mmetsp:Transcript_2079/g.4903  ORF Transcript_2079/g.4903 Transcript_2079/m.4903 type:complete len:230 (+) Transcript_2079:6782-7471(+)
MPSRASRRLQHPSTMPTLPQCITGLVERLMKWNRWPYDLGPEQVPTNFLKHAPNMAPIWGAFLLSHAFSTGSQSRSLSETKMMPVRETVAGDALRRSSTSKSSFTLSVMGTRSPLARVSILLSSSTVLRFSIHSASTGPSHTIHMMSLRLRSLNLAHMEAKMPSSHSPDILSVSPNISSARMALGFMRVLLCTTPVVAERLSCRLRIIHDLPLPAGPTIMIPCLTMVVS